MRKISLLILLAFLAPFFNPTTATAGDQVSIRTCQFQGLQFAYWTDGEVERTVACFANKFGVSVYMAKAVAWRESRYHEDVYNGTCCGGVFQHHLRYWPSRADQYPDWQRWMNIPSSDCWCNPRLQSLVTIKMVRNGGWGPWGQ